jgi:outer membrane immunogenic protein
MKKTLAAATLAALVGVAGAASAADLYKGGSMKDVPVYVPPPTWTGFYIGAHVGGFWADINNRDMDGYLLGTTAWGNNNNSGVFGGGTVGYNYQTGAFVFGVEADFGGAGLTGNWNNGSIIAAGNNGYLWAKNDASFYADVTGRLGYAAGPALFYVKGGWAYLDTNLSVGGHLDGVDWSVNTGSLDGWTIGGGIEYMWSPSWSVKAEYLYFDFGRNHADWVDPTGLDWRFDRDLTINSFKVGLNYHFGNVYTPLK